MPTSPAPDAAAPPGMCPGIVVKGGGGGAGGGSGDGSGGKGGAGGDGSGDGEGAGGDGKSAPDPAKYPKCGTASHPVDVVTGRAFTHAMVDLELPGPLPFRFARVYSSEMAARDVGLGYGWAHTLGWEIEVGRRDIKVWNEQGVAIVFPMVAVGGEAVGPFGWVLRRGQSGFALDADDGGVWRMFSASQGAEGEQATRFRLTSLEDRNHNRIVLTYANGRLSEVLDSAGRVIRVRSTAEGRIATVEVKNALHQGKWVTFGSYSYDDEGNLLTATDADGFSSRYGYDDAHRMTSDTDRTGLTFHFVYGSDGRCVESWGDYPGKVDPSLVEHLPKRLADGSTVAKGIHHCRFEYGAGGYSEVADSTQVRRFFGNAHGTLDKSVEGGGVTTATYREDGHLTSTTDPMGGTTTFERDTRGGVLKVVDPMGRETLVERDAAGLPIRVVDPAGGETRIERDARGNVVTVVDAVGAVRSYRYDERGLVTEAHSAVGLTRRFEHDAQGNLASVTEPNGAVWRFSYDGLGRRLSEVDPLGAETRWSYSPRGDLLVVRDALGGVMHYSYDGEGHVTRLVDQKGRATELFWGGYHKLCARRDALGHEVRLRYNLEGELVEVHNERGEVHELRYDTSGKLIGETTFDGRKLTYRNDLAGRMERSENGLGQVTELSYDAAGQLVKRTLPDGSSEELRYDARGDLVAAKGPGGELRLERDGQGRIVRELQAYGGAEHWVESRYDAEGERIARKTSLGHTEDVVRGSLGERTQTLLDGMHQVEHRADMLGREVARNLAAGGWIQSSYDQLGRVARRTAGGVQGGRAMGPDEPEWLGPRNPHATVDKSYRYDWDGELIESWDRDLGKTQYEYDPVGQLLAMVPEKARTELFRYDPTGNLYEAGADAEPREYGKGNRLLRKGNTEYDWDGDGRLIAKRTRDPGGAAEQKWTYHWDAAGLMQAAQGPDGLVVEFKYDPFARRIEKRVTRKGGPGEGSKAVSRTRFVWDGDVLVHEITERAREDGDPVVEERTYCFEDNGFEPVAHRERKRDDVGVERGGWFHYVNDPIGTPERLVGESGEVACELRRSAWGETEALPGAKASTPIRFRGQYADAETGLTYNRFRYTMAGGDLFCSADPLGLIAGTHAYRTVWNPINWMDPFGLATMREAEALLNASENRAFPGGTNVGHANWHVPPPGPNSAAAHAASRGNANNTTFRNRKQAIRTLRDCMTANEQELNALAPGETKGGIYNLTETLDGEHSANGNPSTRVNVNSVSYRFGKLPNGDIHLLHFQPHGT